MHNSIIVLLSLCCQSSESDKVSQGHSFLNKRILQPYSRDFIKRANFSGEILLRRRTIRGASTRAANEFPRRSLPLLSGSISPEFSVPTVGLQIPPLLVVLWPRLRPRLVHRLTRVTMASEKTRTTGRNFDFTVMSRGRSCGLESESVD